MIADKKEVYKTRKADCKTVLIFCAISLDKQSFRRDLERVRQFALQVSLLSRPSLSLQRAQKKRDAGNEAERNE